MMVQAFDNDRKVAYCTPAKPRFIGFEAAHQSIHEREGAYLDLQDLEDLSGARSLALQTWRESYASWSGSNQSKTL